MLLDQFLGWAVIAFPFLLSILFIFIPAKTEDKEKHMKWRYVLVGVGAVFSLVAWWQQSRSLQAAKKDRDEAIKQTSDQVTKSVTEAVSNQYKDLVSSLTNQIGDLKGQLAEQGKKVDVIQKSNIVTGKKPVRVEVTNPSSGTNSNPPLEVENIKLYSEPERSTHQDAPYAMRITLQANVSIDSVYLAVTCENPLKYAEMARAEEGATWFGGEEIYKKDPRIFVINMKTTGKALLRPDAPIAFHLYSDQPIVITKFERTRR